MIETAEKNFAFGKNWEHFVETKWNESRVASAQEKLLSTLQRKDLQGLAFLDIGCGSGLHSLAALRAGAAQIISFDYDPDSVKITEHLRAKSGSPAHWTVMRGSVLDSDFMKTLPKADIVYAWGVLHHTGNVWQALENAVIPLKRSGTFFLALYSHTLYENATLLGHPSPQEWLEIKKHYNRSSKITQWFLEWRYALTSGFTHSLWEPGRTLRSTYGVLKQIREYQKSRGMDYWTDVRDWLGGWPMEFVKEQNCLSFLCEKKGLECVRMLTGEGNTEYLFYSPDQGSYWDAIVKKRETLLLPGPFTNTQGKAWSADVPGLEIPAGSILVLLENGVRLPFAQATPPSVEKFGAGRYHFQKGTICFSSSDNSNPNTSGKKYAYYFET